MASNSPKLCQPPGLAEADVDGEAVRANVRWCRPAAAGGSGGVKHVVQGPRAASVYGTAAVTRPMYPGGAEMRRNSSDVCDSHVVEVAGHKW
jgi:hypothetical protein